MSKFLDTIYKTINKGTIKSHSRCGGVNINVLKYRHVEITTIDDSVLEIKIGPFVECFELTSHRAGTRYMHWIRLNKTLIKLSEKIGNFPEWMYDYSDIENLSQDFLGLPRDVNKFSKKDVKRQYKLLSRRFHPDLGGSDELLHALVLSKNHALSFFKTPEDYFDPLKGDF